MNCKEIRERLLTDEAEEQGSPEMIEAMDAHLADCPACREYRARLQTEVLQPLRKALRAAPPESVWHNIKASILAEQADRARQPIWTRYPSLSDFFSKPAFAGLAALTIMVFVLATYLPYRSRQAAYSFIDDQIEYAWELGQENDSFEDGLDDLGTTVEEFLL